MEFLRKYKDLIKERTGNIPRDERLRVYWESYSDFQTVSNAAGSVSELLESVACINIADDLPVPYPKISNEWVLEQNPDMIVKNISSTSGIMGHDVYDDNFSNEEYKRVRSRLSWTNLDAIKNNKFIMLSSTIASSPDGSVVGTLIIAKTAYPDRFTGIDPNGGLRGDSPAFS